MEKDALHADFSSDTRRPLGNDNAPSSPPSAWDVLCARAAAMPPDPLEASPSRAVVYRIAGHLGAAITGHHSAGNAVAALRHIVSDLELLVDATPAELSRLEELIALATPAVADDAAPQLAPEAVYLGLAAASVLLRNLRLPEEQREPLPLLEARIDHACLVADELDAVIRRRRIEASGDQLRRSIAINRALAATAAGTSLH